MRRTAHDVGFDQQPQAPVGAGTEPGPSRRGLYVSVTVKFAVAQVLAAGWLVAFLAVSLLLDRQPPLRRTHPAVPVTVLVAARNEADRIQETISYIARQDYPGPIEVLVVDNGSTDGTRAVAEAYATGQRVAASTSPAPARATPSTPAWPRCGPSW